MDAERDSAPDHLAPREEASFSELTPILAEPRARPATPLTPRQSWRVDSGPAGSSAGGAPLELPRRSELANDLTPENWSI